LKGQSLCPHHDLWRGVISIDFTGDDRPDAGRGTGKLGRLVAEILRLADAPVTAVAAVLRHAKEICLGIETKSLDRLWIRDNL
jgi:hypothetical protein